MKSEWLALPATFVALFFGVAAIGGHPVWAADVAYVVLFPVIAVAFVVGVVGIVLLPVAYVAAMTYAAARWLVLRARH